MSQLSNAVKNSFFVTYYGAVARGLFNTIILNWPFLIFTGAAYLGGYMDGARGEGMKFAVVFIIGAWALICKTIELFRILGKYEDPNKFDVAQELGLQKSNLQAEVDHLRKENIDLETKLFLAEDAKVTSDINHALDRYQAQEHKFLESMKEDIFKLFKMVPEAPIKTSKPTKPKTTKTKTKTTPRKKTTKTSK